MPQSSLHLDILMGRDELIEPADVFLGLFPPLFIYFQRNLTSYCLGMETGPSLDTRKEMEKCYRV